ncbi:hypothetical protein ACIRF8_09880 [Streptomyces sp. NPDC102406]|uniref:hypothetical protein n=1 Tax=Streptomyces sp. NPDC102406 TaxID=3366171 RepID=UPI003817332D
MILSSEDVGLWLVPVLLALGVAVVSPVVCVVLAVRVVLRIARSVAEGAAWRAFTPGTWLLAAGSGAFGAGCRFSVTLFGETTPWVDSASFVCGCFALAAAAMAAFTAVLNQHPRGGAERS